MAHNTSSVNTSYFGIGSRVLIPALIVVFTVLFLVVTVAWIIYLCSRKSKPFKPHLRLSNPLLMEGSQNSCTTPSMDKRFLSHRISEVEMKNAKLDRQLVISSEQWSDMNCTITAQRSGNVAYLESVSTHSSVVPDTWRRDRIALKEIEVVTDGFADKNLISSGNYGVVYRG